MLLLLDTFNAFVKTLLDEITEIQTVFNQMEAAVDQYVVDKNDLEIKIKQLRIDNDQLLNQIMSQDIVHIAMNSVDICVVNKSCVDTCKKHCTYLELATQLNQEIFQRENSGENLNAPIFNQLFEINESKAQSQEKDMVIRKLKDIIKSLSGKENVENIKKDIDEIETINIELEHSVAKLLSENENLRKEQEHLKSFFKDQFDSIKQTCVRSKEQTLKNELRKLKGKNVVDTAVSKPIATIALGMFKLDIETISPRLKNNRDAHEVYLDKMIEYTDTLYGIELLVYASKTCPDSSKPSEILVAVTPLNKDKKVRFFEPVIASRNVPKQSDSHPTKDSNKPLLPSTRVNSTTGLLEEDLKYDLWRRSEEEPEEDVDIETPEDDDE
ncbi:hypothetical protein Tco_0791527 [Tanacetum coccineum]